jgi:hypothetical protein
LATLLAACPRGKISHKSLLYFEGAWLFSESLAEPAGFLLPGAGVAFGAITPGAVVRRDFFGRGGISRRRRRIAGRGGGVSGVRSRDSGRPANNEQ